MDRGGVARVARLLVPLALAVTVGLVLAACASGDEAKDGEGAAADARPTAIPTVARQISAPVADTPVPTADISNTPPKVVVSETTPSTKPDDGWFVRTVAPLGDERGLCIKLWGWTPTNIKFDVPAISHTCKHGWWNMEGRFDRAALDRGRLEMPYFERCLEAASSETGASLFAKPCDEGPLQRFSFVETGRIVLASNPELCMSVPDEPHIDAGGDDFWMNGLILEACSEQGTERQVWTFTEPL